MEAVTVPLETLLVVVLETVISIDWRWVVVP
jgi:hypothetical protein